MAKPFRIADVLSSLLAASPFSARLGQAEIVTRWGAIVGPELAKVTEAKSITADGTLIVDVKTHAWMTELSLMEPELLKALNGEADPAPVQRIRWQLRRVGGAAGSGPGAGR